MRLHSLLLFALLATPALLAAQQPGDLAREMDRSTPVDLLLEKPDEVRLSPQQVERLQVVRRELAEQNRPLIERLLRIRREVHAEIDTPLRDATAEERALFRSRVAEARPLLQRIRENNQRAMRRVGGILTREQRVRVRERLRAGWWNGAPARSRLREGPRHPRPGRGRGG